MCFCGSLSILKLTSNHFSIFSFGKLAHGFFNTFTTFCERIFFCRSTTKSNSSFRRFTTTSFIFFSKECTTSTLGLFCEIAEYCFLVRICNSHFSCSFNALTIGVVKTISPMELKRIRSIFFKVAIMFYAKVIKISNSKRLGFKETCIFPIFAPC